MIKIGTNPSDLNALNETGFYTCGAVYSIDNYPSGTPGICIVIYAGVYECQIVITNDGKRFTRSTINGGREWNDWA